MSTFEKNQFSDQLNIDTPEQVELQFSIAGIGSRFVAALLDLLILGAFYLCMIFVLVLVASGGSPAAQLDTAGKWFIAIFILINFCLVWGYYALFEAYWHGQTPGKRVMKLRVLQDSGRQITLFESLARNLVRVIDFQLLYLVGVVSMLCNRRNKRLGDFAAGTIVVHERLDDQPLLHHTSTTLLAPVSFASSPSQPQQRAPWAQPLTTYFPADAVARLGQQDLIVIESFFARMLDLPMATRAAIAYRIAGQMASKMGVPLPDANPERVMESIVYQMRGSGRAF